MLEYFIHSVCIYAFLVWWIILSLMAWKSLFCWFALSCVLCRIPVLGKLQENPFHKRCVYVLDWGIWLVYTQFHVSIQFFCLPSYIQWIICVCILCHRTIIRFSHAKYTHVCTFMHNNYTKSSTVTFTLIEPRGSPHFSAFHLKLAKPYNNSFWWQRILQCFYSLCVLDNIAKPLFPTALEFSLVSAL